MATTQYPKVSLTRKNIHRSIVDGFSSGLPISTLALRLGIHQRRVRSIISQVGLSRKKTRPEIKLTPEEAAYIAGIVDGEGFFSITTQSRDRYYVRMGVANTHYGLIAYLKKKIAGYIFLRKKVKGERKSWTWHASSSQHVRSIALAIFPYMIIKKRQARLAIDFSDHVYERSNNGMASALSRRDLEFRKRARRKMVQLNGRKKLKDLIN